MTPLSSSMAGAIGASDRGEAGVRSRLRSAGLRPTRQRVALGQLLFGKGDRHVSAEELHEEAVEASVPVSLATIYNTLHQFTAAGLLREVVVESTRTYFDTNTRDHHHMFIEGENRVVDVPPDAVTFEDIPKVLEGFEVVRVDVVVRVRPKS